MIALLLLGLGVAAFLLLPWSLDDKLFAVAYGLDPQRPSHTYVLGGRPLPLEARKLGMFGGFLITCLGVAAAGRARAASFPPRRIVVVLIAFIALMGADGLNATLYDLGWPHLYSPDLRLRLATGLLCGVAMAGLLLPAVNGALWRTLVPAPSFARGRDVAGALLLCASFFLLVDARPAVLYYPFALLGVGGLVVELTLINVIFVLVLARRVGAADSAWDALPVIAAALCFTIFELVFMSGLRFLLLGDVTSQM